ncbi:hypothetical protein F4Y59_13670 [Candidatus Poribacteria bacterium]|nr:hypothetical protein [Candidatus Poribacteria bacterium]MXY29194.1 hypothetical protein [Candidatus Poribacteria bacterium]MYK17153.1 hypothetical protein [Candidatus Poribacteria bacterium]
MTEMTEQEMLAAQKRADAVVDKVRGLVDLENRVLEARAVADDSTADSNGLKDLEAQLERRVAELNEIANELQWATPCFRAYVLPQISEVMGKQTSFRSEERKDLENVIAALTAEEDSEFSEALAADIIARLRSNIEKSFGA